MQSDAGERRQSRSSASILRQLRRALGSWQPLLHAVRKRVARSARRCQGTASLVDLKFDAIAILLAHTSFLRLSFPYPCTALGLLSYDNRKLFFWGNAVSPLERGTTTSDNEESFPPVSEKGRTGRLPPSVSSASYGSCQLMAPYCTRGEDIEISFFFLLFVSFCFFSLIF